MWLLIVGVILFLGIHSTRIFAADFRSQAIARLGLNSWKLIYSLVSALGLALIIYGYSQARLTPDWLWISPVWTRHLAALLMLPAFILLAATYIPGTYLKAKVGHPMFLAVKFWALAHLIANGTLADVILFGSFLVWAVLGFANARRRDRLQGTTYIAASPLRDVMAVILGLVLWAIFAMVLHKLLFGVAPFAR